MAIGQRYQGGGICAGIGTNEKDAASEDVRRLSSAEHAKWRCG